MKRVDQVTKDNRAYQGYEIDGTILEIIISNDEVASSSISIDGFFSIALAIAILCLCPPDKRTPFSPITVSKPSG